MTTVAPNKLFKKPLKLPLKASVPPPPPAKPTVTVIIKVER
jgi:hypothetical protein